MFFVASLPRTRTFWLSRYFSALPGVFCHHELLNGLTQKQQFYGAMEVQHEGLNIGDSDCGLYITDFHTRWPDAPVLIVDRDIDEVYASLCGVFYQHNLPPPVKGQLYEQLDALQHIRALHVDFHELDERLPEIHEYLGVGEYSKDLADLMNRKNLQLQKIIPNPVSYRLWLD